MKKLLLLTLLSVGVIFLSQGVSAHVLITDESGQEGAILHIIPDDDPIAGEESQIYFDSQNNNGVDSVTMRITGEGVAELREAAIDGTLATFTYTFPYQGVYELAITASRDNTSSSFTHTQRVSRGVSASAVENATHTWAEIALLTSALGIIITFIIAVNHRKSIAKHSTF